MGLARDASSIWIGQPMRQLTALDALFLAAENDRTHGHVSALGVYDPITASGRPLVASFVRVLVSQRIHLLPPCRWRMAGVPLGLDHLDDQGRLVEDIDQRSGKVE